MDVAKTIRGAVAGPVQFEPLAGGERGRHAVHPSCRPLLLGIVSLVPKFGRQKLFEPRVRLVGADRPIDPQYFCDPIHAMNFFARSAD